MPPIHHCLHIHCQIKHMMNSMINTKDCANHSIINMLNFVVGSLLLKQNLTLFCPSGLHHGVPQIPFRKSVCHSSNPFVDLRPKFIIMLHMKYHVIDKIPVLISIIYIYKCTLSSSFSYHYCYYPFQVTFKSFNLTMHIYSYHFL